MPIYTGNLGLHTSCVESLPTSSIPHLFGSCLRGFQKDLKPIIILGAAATCWSIWLCINDLVFEKKLVYSPLHIVFFRNPLATHMRYPPKALRTGFGVEGIATIDASGYNVFLLGTWMTI